MLPKQHLPIFVGKISSTSSSCVSANLASSVLVALFAYYVNFGSIIGALIDNYTKHYMDKRSYRIPLACLYIVPTLLAIGLFFVPESPRTYCSTRSAFSQVY